MLLPDHRIRAWAESGGPDDNRFSIEPYDDALVQPASYDVRLGQWFRTFNRRVGVIDPAEDQPDLTELVTPDEGEPFLLHPGEFALGHTFETVQLPDLLVARVEGKSSLGRLGLLVHATAGYVDPGWRGQITLELGNLAPLPIKLWPGMKIAQLSFEQLTSACEHPYGSKVNGSRYQGQSGPVASRSHIGFLRGLPTTKETAA